MRRLRRPAQREARCRSRRVWMPPVWQALSAICRWGLRSNVCQASKRGLPEATGRFSDCGPVKRKAGRPSGVMVLFEVTWFAPQHGIRWWSSPMYGSGCAECSASHRPARDRPTSAPSGLRFPPPRREFGSGYGLLFPFELGFVLPQCQHQHRELPSGYNCRLGKAPSSSKSDCPAFQRRELLHPTDQGRRRLEQQAPHGSIAAP